MGLAGIALAERRAAELAAPDDERVVEHARAPSGPAPAPPTGRRCPALLFELREQVAVLVPAGVHELHEPHAPLEQPAGDQAVVGERALAAGRRARSASSVGFGSFEKSTRSGTLVCIRNAISYWAMRVSISGSP